MINVQTMPPTTRSPASLDFEVRLLTIAMPDTVLGDIHESRIDNRLPDMTVIAADLEAGNLIIERAGVGLEDLFGTNLVGSDGRNILPSSSPGNALELVRYMLERPCGLWQIIETHSHGADPAWLEYSLYPLRDRTGRCTKLCAHLWSWPGTSRIIDKRQTLVSKWINLGFGIPAENHEDAAP